MRLAVSNILEAVGNKQVAVGGMHEARRNLAAAKQFARYKPEEKHEVRSLKVEGDELQRLRQRREMLKSMAPEQALQVMELYRGLTFFEALALARREGRIIASNIVHDRILTKTKDQKSLEQFYPYGVWTGTLVIYEVPDKPFREQVIFSPFSAENLSYTITFIVPKQFRGKINCALVVEHPDLEVVDLGNNQFEFVASNIKLIEGFRSRETYRLKEEEYGLPTGESIAYSISDSGYLWLVHQSYIGPVQRFLSRGAIDYRIFNLLTSWFGEDDMNVALF